MRWYCVSIFIFCLEPTVREKLDENDFRHCYGIFSKVPFRNHLITAMFKVLTQQLQSTLKTPFETIQYSWRFNGYRSPYELFFSWVNIFKRKSVKGTGKIIIYTIGACSSKNIAPNFTLCYSDNFCRNLFTFLLLDILYVLEL